MIKRLKEVLDERVPCHVVISMINGIGDGILALPLIRYVIDLVGRELVTVWALPKFAQTCFAEFGDVLLPMAVENRMDPSHKKYQAAAIRKRIAPDSVICWVSLNSYVPVTENEAYAIAECKPKYVWSFSAKHIRRDPVGHRLFHMADQYFRVIGEEAMPLDSDRRPTTQPQSQILALALKSAARRRNRRFIAVHAETRLAEKQWPVQHWLRLGQLLQRDAELVVLGHQQDALSGAPFCRPAELWDEQVAILCNADGFIGIDSCFAHIADACNIPGLVLFASRPNIEQWLPKANSLKPIIVPSCGLQQLQPDVVAGMLDSALEARTNVLQNASGD